MDKQKKNPQRITKNKSFINKFSWEGLNFLSEIDDCKKTEKISVTFALNILYAKKEKIYPSHDSKHRSNRETQFFLLSFSLFSSLPPNDNNNVIILL